MIIFRVLFGIYALIIFLCSLVFLVPAYLLIFNFWSNAKAPHAAHGISRAWAKLLFILFFIRMKVEGKEKIDPKRTYVFISNHQSQLDIPAFALACSNTFRFLAKEELTKIPLLGYIIKNLYITVNRSDRNDRSRSIEMMVASLQEGISVFICPEGTRNRSSDPLLPFRDGAFRLAIQSQLPLAVLTIRNSGQLNSPRKLLQLSPGVLHAAWSEPIDTRGMGPADLESLKEQARQIMLRQLSRGNFQ